MTGQRWVLAGMITIVAVGAACAEEPAADAACSQWAATIRHGDELTDAMRVNAH